MKAMMRLLAIEIVFLLLGILGGRVGLVFMDTTLIWRSLGSPPDKAVRIVDGNESAVHVQTASGAIYYCHFKSPHECWIQHNSPLDHAKRTSNKPWYDRIYDEPPVLSGVVDTQNFYSVVSEYSEVLSIYAITDKGKVYVWQDGYSSPYDGLIFIYAIPIALLCGFVIWGLFELRGLLTPRRR